MPGWRPEQESNL